jgi:hypothetical protein
MKKIIISILVLIFCAISSNAQITQEQANAIVLQYIQNEVTLPCVLYASTYAPSESGLVITTYKEETVKVKYACWAYYLNEYPDINEPCQHRYLFVKGDNGNLLEIITSNDLSPNLTEWMLVPLSVTNSERNNAILFYPNPTTGELTIENGELTIMSIEVFDVYGRKSQISNLKSQNLISINISHLSAGIYFVKIQTETTIYTQKVVKQ